MYTSSINLDEEIVLELILKKNVKPKTTGISKKKKIWHNRNFKEEQIYYGTSLAVSPLDFGTSLLTTVAS